MGNQNKRVIPGVPDTDKGWTLTWDLENRLKSVIKVKKKDNVIIESSVVEFKYDPFGRRIEKKLTPGVNGIARPSTTWSYIYEGDNIAVEIYTPPTGPQEKTFYTHGPDVDEHLAMERGGQFYYFHQDGLNNVTTITDQNSKVKMSYDYDSFGMANSTEYDVNGIAKPMVTFRNSYTYTGREWDKETGLYYYRFRYYDPMEGRFILKDPIGFAGGDVNVFAYTDNNPVNFIDSDGLYGRLILQGAARIIVKTGVFMSRIIQHLPALDAIGRFIAKEKMDGSPGYLDLPTQPEKPITPIDPIDPSFDNYNAPKNNKKWPNDINNACRG
jgi:RHS repeat-associated protein